MTSFEESECFENSLYWLSLNKDNTITCLNIYFMTKRDNDIIKD